MYTASFDIIKPKDVINPVNEVEVEGYGFNGVFYCLKFRPMAKEKNGFVLYCDVIHTAEKLTDEQAGKLFKHILRYVNDQNPECDFVTEIAFEPIKQTLKRDLVKYENKRAQNKENALKRWNANASERIQNDAKDAVRVSDSVRVRDINTIPSIEEFIAYALSKEPTADKNELRLKYESWKVNDWCTNVKGKNKKILNWKSTILNTLPYIRKINPNDISDDLQQTANILAKLNYIDTKDYKNVD